VFWSWYSCLLENGRATFSQLDVASCCREKKGEQSLIIIFAVLLSTAVAVVSSFLVADFLSRKFKSMGITGLDVHKRDAPVTAEMGGLSVLVSVALGALLFYMLEPDFPATFIAGILTVLLVGIVGVIDDIFTLRQRYKPFLVALMSAPLAYSLLGTTGISLPLVGKVPFGILFPIAIVPLAIATSANLSNMLAGFNGLESGSAIIGLSALVFLSWYKGEHVGLALGALFLGGYLGFLFLNWYPAKIFPGDTGTLMAGAAIVAVGFVSGLVFAAVVVSIPAGFDFVLKISTRSPFAARSIHGNTKLSPEGVLMPPNYPALSHAFMRLAAQSERTLVSSILAMEAIYGILAIALTILL